MPGFRTRRALVTSLAAVIALAWPPPLAASRTSTSPTADITLRARAFEPGELMIVAMTFDAEVPAAEVRVFDRATPAYSIGPRQWQALVGIDLDQPPGDYVLTVHGPAGSVAGEAALTVSSRQFPVRTLRVNPNFVNPPASVMTRIAADSQLLSEAYASSPPERLWEERWQRPVPHRANSRFGSRSIFNGEPRSPHSGADFLSPAGTPVAAPNRGRVAVARDTYFNGNLVIIDHGLGVFSQLAHLSRIDVREGEMVDAGQIVGRVGATGRVTGAHLHWGVRVGEARVDPLAVLALFAAPAK